jgi:hypothetical protein
MNDDFGFWVAKMLGAFAGSAFSLAFMPSRTMWETSVRLICRLFVGTVFGSSTAGWLEKQFELSVGTEMERTIIGSFIAAFMAWYALGFAVRLVSSARTPRELKEEE